MVLYETLLVCWHLVTSQGTNLTRSPPNIEPSSSSVLLPACGGGGGGGGEVYLHEEGEKGGLGGKLGHL